VALAGPAKATSIAAIASTTRSELILLLVMIVSLS
jgi:hypothetical protein